MTGDVFVVIIMIIMIQSSLDRYKDKTPVNTGEAFVLLRTCHGICSGCEEDLERRPVFSVNGSLITEKSSLNILPIWLEKLQSELFSANWNINWSVELQPSGKNNNNNTKNNESRQTWTSQPLLSEFRVQLNPVELCPIRHVWPTVCFTGNEAFSCISL